MKGTRVVAGLHPPMRRVPTRPVVTVGVFDGVHLAHQQLIRSTIRLAHRFRGESVVMTFHPDPQVVLHPAEIRHALMPLDVRVDCLRALGVDWIWIIPFTRAFARVSAAQFIRRMLIGRLHARAVVVGETFAFGHDRRGNLQVLRTLGAAHGMRVVPVRPIIRAGTPVSSSRIRRLIAHGQLAQARRLLGRLPALYGEVVRGAGRGRRLGYPTANIQLVDQVLPPAGVYAVAIDMRGHRRRWPGVMNLGVRPTFGTGPLVCEVHLLGFSGNLLGRSVTVSLSARLRSERCFATPDALVCQVRRDVARARHLV